MVKEAPIQVIGKQRTGEQIKVISSATYFYSVIFENRVKYVSVPDSFIQGLQECLTGRTVDMSVAMTQPPPDRAI